MEEAEVEVSVVFRTVRRISRVQMGEEEEVIVAAAILENARNRLRFCVLQISSFLPVSVFV
jgi:hypothetical protein